MFSFGIASAKGVRQTMEDEHLIYHFDDHITLFGVFDGHGGGEVSKLIKSELPSFLSKYLIQANLKDIENTKQLLTVAVILFDQYLHSIYKSSRAGSTLLFVIYAHGILYVVNLGDSRAILFNNAGTILLETVDHKPANPSETQRIQSVGAGVIFGRINGSIAVSRALGDFVEGLKCKGDEYLGVKSPLSPVPDVYALKLPRDEKLTLVLACDGLWDRYKSEEVASEIASSRDMTLNEIAEKIVSKAINERKTSDNVTVMIVQFN